jgi:hypothetical protein
MGEPVADDAGLAAPRACKDKQGTFGVQDRFSLGGVQFFEEDFFRHTLSPIIEKVDSWWQGGGACLARV